MIPELSSGRPGEEPADTRAAEPAGLQAGRPEPGAATEPTEPTGGWTGPVGLARLRRLLQPGLGIKRWYLLFALSTLVGALGVLQFVMEGPLRQQLANWLSWVRRLPLLSQGTPYLGGLLLIVLALVGALGAMVMLSRTVLRGSGTDPRGAMDRLATTRSLARGPRVVAIGGGTGLSQLLMGLKTQTSNITAVVAVTDDGGSSGRLREALGMIAPGDLTDCYAALSDNPVLSRLLLHRFTRGEGLAGHTFGNLMLATLNEERQAQGESGLAAAVTDMNAALRVRGAVYPASLQPATLLAHLSDGRTVRGESVLAREKGPAQIERIELDPPRLPVQDAVLAAIREAELIVLGPGSLYTSLLPALLVPGIAAALREAPAGLVYVASIMTEPGETDGLTLTDHDAAILHHLGRRPDWLLVNRQLPDDQVLARYRAEGAERLMVHGLPTDVRQRLAYGDVLKPGTAHHDPDRLTARLLALLDQPQ
jgi:uncharacterized cofD-like protein